MNQLTDNSFASLTGKTALVTGATSGIGKAIALELARAGSNVIVHYGKSVDAARQVVTQLESLRVSAVALQADLRNACLKTFVDQAWEQFGKIDIWVNNAGVDLLTGDAPQLPFEEKLDLLWQIDVKGTVFLSRAALEKMRTAGQGVILNIGWDQADRGMEGDSAELFSTSKNAIMGFTRSLAMSAAPEVRVNCIAPGWIQTAWGHQTGEYWQQRIIDETPLRRWGQPEDIAKLARFLVSEEASYLTGQVINANGGAVR